MNRAKKLYRSMLLSFPTIVLTFFLLFCLLLFANLAIADSWSPKAQQWQSVGGKLVSSDTHSFNTFWYAAGNGMYWKDDEDQGKVPPRHSGDEVSKDILVKKGQITVRGPGFLGRVTRTKGSAGAYLKEPKAKTRFISATLGGQEMYKEDNKWTGKWVTRYDMNDFDPGKHHSGWVPANTTVTLDIWAVSYWSECGHFWRGFAAPKEVEYEFWFFPREGGEVINVSKYGPDVPDVTDSFTWSTIEPGSNFIIEPPKLSRDDIEKPLPGGIFASEVSTFDKYTKMINEGVSPERISQVKYQDYLANEVYRQEVWENDLLFAENYLYSFAAAGEACNYILGCGVGKGAIFSFWLDPLYAYADTRIIAVERDKTFDEAHELGKSAAIRKGFENIGAAGFSRIKHFSKKGQIAFNTAKEIFDYNIFDPANTAPQAIPVVYLVGEPKIEPANVGMDPFYKNQPSWRPKYEE